MDPQKQTFIIVTDHSHSRRAEACFRKAGYRHLIVCAGRPTKAEIPGVKKEDIHVAIDGNQVSIEAEVKRETEEKKGEKVVRSERYFGKQYRSFTLATDIDAAAAAAKYADGVLELEWQLSKEKERWLWTRPPNRGCQVAEVWRLKK